MCTCVAESYLDNVKLRASSDRGMERERGRERECHEISDEMQDRDERRIEGAQGEGGGRTDAMRKGRKSLWRHWKCEVRGG